MQNGNPSLTLSTTENKASIGNIFNRSLNWIRNRTEPSYPFWLEITLTFGWGLFFSGFQRGLFDLITFIIIYEFIYYLIHVKNKNFPYFWPYRVGTIMSSLLGWIVGTYLLDYDPLYVGNLRFFKDWPASRHTYVKRRIDKNKKNK